MGRNVAIIINGDTEQRHLQNVDRAIAALKAEDASYEIAVASTQQPSQPQLVSHYKPADAAGIRQLVSELTPTLQGDDTLVIYVTGHGSLGDRDEGCVELNGSCYSLASLRNELARLRFGKRIVVMDQCYAGRGFRLFADDKTTVVTEGSSNETVCCGDFAPYFWSSQVTDLNNDRMLTVEERVLYALRRGHPSSLTQYYSPSTRLSLSGTSERAPHFPASVARVTDMGGLNQQLARLSETDVALVMFSADWCQACHELLPHFQAQARRMGGRFLAVQAEGVNGSEQEFSDRFGIRTFPTFALMGKRRDGSFKVVAVRDLSNLAPALAELAEQSREDEFTYYFRRLQKGDPDPDFRARAVTILSHHPEHAQEIISELIGARLQDSDTHVIMSALEALTTIGKSETPRIVPAMIEALAFIMRTREMRQSDVVRAACEDAFKKLGAGMAPAIPAMIAMSHSPDRQTQEAAFLALGYLGTAASEEVVKQLLQSGGDEASRALGKIASQNPRAYDQLIASVNQGTEADRERALQALNECIREKEIAPSVRARLPRLIDLLSPLLQSRSILRFTALSMLKTLSGVIPEYKRNVIAAIISGFKHPDPFLRSAAIDACEDISLFDPSTARVMAPAIAPLKDDSEPMVREAAAHYLNSYGAVLQVNAAATYAITGQESAVGGAIDAEYRLTGRWGVNARTGVAATFSRDGRGSMADLSAGPTYHLSDRSPLRRHDFFLNGPALGARLMLGDEQRIVPVFSPIGAGFRIDIAGGFSAGASARIIAARPEDRFQAGAETLLHIGGNL